MTNRPKLKALYDHAMKHPLDFTYQGVAPENPTIEEKLTDAALEEACIRDCNIMFHLPQLMLAACTIFKADKKQRVCAISFCQSALESQMKASMELTDSYTDLASKEGYPPAPDHGRQ